MSTVDWEAKMREEREQRDARIAGLVKKLVGEMQNLPIAVIVHFDGYGDSGDIEHTYLSGLGDTGEPTHEPPDLHGPPTHPLSDDDTVGDDASVLNAEKMQDLAREACYELLHSYRPGWEINEGSHGTFTIYNDGRVQCDFMAREVVSTPQPFEIGGDE